MRRAVTCELTISQQRVMEFGSRRKDILIDPYADLLRKRLALEASEVLYRLETIRPIHTWSSLTPN